jgi:hypothetical protein
VFRNVPDDTVLIGRIRKDASLFKAPEADGGETPRRGRKRIYGDALPAPEEIRQDDSIPWQSVEAFAAGKAHTFFERWIPELTEQHTPHVPRYGECGYEPSCDFAVVPLLTGVPQ